MGAILDSPLDRRHDALTRPPLTTEHLPNERGLHTGRDPDPRIVDVTAKIVPAQCVPWPCWSPLPSPVKSFSVIVTPEKAGWVPSIPVSNRRRRCRPL